MKAPTIFAARWAVSSALVAAGVVALPALGFRMIQQTQEGRLTWGDAVSCNAAGGFVHWNTDDIPWRLNNGGVGAYKEPPIQAALASWSNLAGAAHNPYLAGTTRVGWATDAINTVMFASGNGCSGGCMAITALVLDAGQVIVESDISFNTAYTWTTDGSGNDVQAVAAHEFGHSLGVHHTELTSSPTPTMNWSYFGTGGRSLESDDVEALECAQQHYPVGPPATPASLDVAPMGCYGMAELAWSAAATATYYQVQQSSSSNFSSASTIYSGPNLYRIVNGEGTRYYRVKACNGDGCSGWRNGDQAATYYPGCPNS